MKDSFKILLKNKYLNMMMSKPNIILSLTLIAQWISMAVTQCSRSPQFPVNIGNN